MKRASLGVLLAVAVTALGVTGCNDDDDERGGQRASSCKPAADTSTRVESFYRAAPVPPDETVDRGALDETRTEVCRRLVARGVRDAEVRVAGSKEIVTTVPRSVRVSRALDAATARSALRFYDWEPNVLGDRGPDRPFAGPKALFEAVELASRAKPRAEAADLPPDAPSGLTRAKADRDNDSSHARFYLFDSDEMLVAGPLASRDELPPGAPAGSKVLEVPRGIAIVEAQRTPNQAQRVRRFFVLEDDSELSNADIARPRQESDPTGQPVVVFDFTDTGRRRFAALTRRVARRGASRPSGPPEAALQRLAIMLDDEVVSLATIDFRENPEGIDGRTGAQIEGPTGQGGAGELARALRAGPLPVELRLRLAQAR